MKRAKEKKNATTGAGTSAVKKGEAFFDSNQLDQYEVMLKRTHDKDSTQDELLLSFFLGTGDMLPKDIPSGVLAKMIAASFYRAIGVFATCDSGCLTLDEGLLNPQISSRVTLMKNLQLPEGLTSETKFYFAIASPINNNHSFVATEAGVFYWKHDYPTVLGVVKKYPRLFKTPKRHVSRVSVFWRIDSAHFQELFKDHPDQALALIILVRSQLHLKKVELERQFGAARKALDELDKMVERVRRF